MNDLPQTENEEQHAELMRCLSRLSFVGMGLSTELDNALAGLRDLVKNNAHIDRVKSQIEKISKTLLDIDDVEDQPEKQAEVKAVSHETEILQQLLARSLPSDFKKALKLIESNRKNIEAAQIISSIADNIESFLNQSPSKNKGLFGKLFNRGDNRKDTNESANNSSAESIDLVIPDSLRNTLLHLVEQLSAIENNKELANSLSKKVSELTRTEQLVEILEAVTGAFVNFAGHEHEQFEKFLKSLGKRIDRVNTFIEHTISFNQEFSNNSKALDSELKEQVSDINLKIDASSSLPEIKLELAEKMNAIVARVNLFCELQQNNHQLITKNCEKLKEQLNATEDESSRLKDELAAQRLRAQTDPLTHLPNRYSYNDRLTQEYNRWRRYRSPLSLVVGDIDYFKKVNDNYGHDAGDQVLVEIAHYLQDEIRESDFIARYGGEEFVILLPETSLVDSAKAINKLRQGIKDIKIAIEDQTLSVAMSFGIAEFENNDTPKAVFSRADKALYRAKEKGRDQVCCQRAPSAKE